MSNKRKHTWFYINECWVIPSEQCTLSAMLLWTVWSHLTLYYTTPIAISKAHPPCSHFVFFIWKCAFSTGRAFWHEWCNNRCDAWVMCDVTYMHTCSSIVTHLLCRGTSFLLSKATAFNFIVEHTIFNNSSTTRVRTWMVRTSGSSVIWPRPRLVVPWMQRQELSCLESGVMMESAVLLKSAVLSQAVVQCLWSTVLSELVALCQCHWEAIVSKASSSLCLCSEAFQIQSIYLVDYVTLTPGPPVLSDSWLVLVNLIKYCTGLRRATGSIFTIFPS